MFPSGMAGVALIFLRILVMATLLVDGTAHWVLVTSFWISLGFVVPAFFLSIGLFTPYCSAICFLLELSILVVRGGEDQFHLVLAILLCGILTFLGPGAYSIDARIFGRRLLTVPPRQ